MGHTCKNGSHLQKWITLGKMSDTLKNVENGSILEQWVILEKMGQIWKNASNWKNE